jgi:hypothetical protein
VEPADSVEVEEAARRWAPEVMARFKRGEKGEVVVAALMEEGLSTEQIQAAFARAIQMAKDERRTKDRRGGALWLIAGSVLVGLAHFTPNSTALHYVLAWGAVAFGLYRLARSFK